ncbi:MAG: pyrroloquinoline quinone biosynthesis protein PqqB [Gemmatimonadales bacterium]|jgi:pyrroloquinoline quinone biosynthesis protein B|nr:pyrroloquinoline quinone biosynthesis protein PqqB [Gemmatimonadales bacterium]
MKVLLLGTAAGGGFPQWNCWCPSCRLARTHPDRARPRTQSSVAVSADGQRWFLLNASPDVREQLARLPAPELPGTRHLPVAGVVLTDAELDHSLGLVLLREGRTLQLYATAAVLHTLEHDSRLLPVTRAFADVATTTLVPGTSTPLRYLDGSTSGLAVEPVVVPAGPPRFASVDEPGHTTGLLVRDASTGGTLAYLPACGDLEPALLDRLAGTDLLLFDGTFWTDDEMIVLGVGTRRAREIDHLPLSGPGGSLERLAALARPRRVYVHVNNTNPILREESAERALVRAAGLEVGMDGMTFTV